jgi:hypothetical protein
MAFCFSVYPISLHKTSKHAHDPSNTKKKKQTEGQKFLSIFEVIFFLDMLYYLCLIFCWLIILVVLLVDYLDLVHLFLNALV